MPQCVTLVIVEKAQEHNEQNKKMIAAMGITFDTEGDAAAVNTDKLCYRTIVIMTDADVDGTHIRTLPGCILLR